MMPASTLLCACLIAACTVNPVDKLIRESSGKSFYGIYYPHDKSSAAWKTFSVHRPRDGGRQTRLVRQYDSSRTACITREHASITIELICIGSEFSGSSRYTRYAFVAAFIEKGYRLLSVHSDVPMVHLKLVEVSDEVTQKGFDLREPIESRKGKSLLVYYLPFTELDAIDEWMSLAQTIYHELVHYVLNRIHGRIENGFSEEFVAHFIADAASLVLIYPDVLREMELPAATWQERANQWTSQLMMLKALEKRRISKYSVHALDSDYEKVWPLTEQIFWSLYDHAISACVNPKRLLSIVMSDLLSKPLSPSESVESAFMVTTGTDQHTTVSACSFASALGGSGEHLPEIRVKFQRSSEVAKEENVDPREVMER